ncbi:hypothetical protein NQ315_008898 [Exocentrus adspersus]|uniref:Uncharacterized protein n=1 Tax=Exocentrus adspersus TaxID=1586481 RepID=A0AAV8V5R5_9CUCU|nr:hypothetical protein NQ315_008898 [Exocentrus adspersus]
MYVVSHHKEAIDNIQVIYGNIGEDMQEDQFQLIHEDPTTSTREIDRQVGISQSRILKENQLYPFHIQTVHALVPEDYPLRVEFCNWPRTSSKILVTLTDEASFTRNGMTNTRNTHVWALENPNEIRETNFQHRFQPIKHVAGIAHNAGNFEKA